MRREYPEAPIVGIGAVIIDQGRVLLVRRGHEPLRGEWSLPGGVLELGETLQQGIVREVLEETGLTVEPESVVEVLDRITLDPSTRGGSGKVADNVRYHYVLVDFVCRVVSGELCYGSDADDARWVKRNDLYAPDGYNLAPVTLAVIEKAFIRLHS